MNLATKFNHLIYKNAALKSMTPLGFITIMRVLKMIVLMFINI